MKNIIIALVLVLSSISLNGQALALSQTDSLFHVSEVLSQNGNISIIKVTSFESETQRDTFLTILNNQFTEVLAREEEYKIAKDVEHETQKKIIADKIKAIEDIKKDKQKNKKKN